MDPSSFLSWVYRKANRPDRYISQADKIVPLLRQTGGVTRHQLDSAVDLAPEILTQLPVALVSAGQLSLFYIDGVPLCRTQEHE